ncbi:MAG: hypothetical protein ACYDDF_14705 [Thermoplasmatota archaeon]
MPADHSTITLRSEIKDRLALLKGRKSWDDFLTAVADQLPVDEAIAEMESRLADLRHGKVKGVPWRAIKAKRAKARRT